MCHTHMPILPDGASAVRAQGQKDAAIQSGKSYPKTVTFTPQPLPRQASLPQQTEPAAQDLPD